MIELVDELASAHTRPAHAQHNQTQILQFLLTAPLVLRHHVRITKCAIGFDVPVGFDRKESIDQQIYNGEGGRAIPGMNLETHLVVNRLDTIKFPMGQSCQQRISCERFEWTL